MTLSGTLNLSGRVATRDSGSRGDGMSGHGGGAGAGDGCIGGSNTSSSTSKHLLEIVVVGAKRRVWAAESKQECRRWVRSFIAYAMLKWRVGSKKFHDWGEENRIIFLI